jgi:acyl-CoA dehydrogenase
MDNSFLSWPFFDDYHRTFARDVKRFVSRELNLYENDDGNDGITARHIFRLLAGNGWLKYSIPSVKSYHQDKIDLRTICLMRQFLGYQSAIADVAFSDPWLAILPVVLFGSEMLKRELLDGYLTGEMLPAFALSEPDFGSDAASIETQARLEGDQYIINGRKTWISNAGLADWYIVFAQTSVADDKKRISAFLVDGQHPGITLEESIKVLSLHTVGTLLFEDVCVPSHRLLGKQGQGFKIAMKVLELFRPTVGAAAVGFAMRAMDEAVVRSMTRMAFHKPICDHQLIQAKLADMHTWIDASALLVYRASWMHDVEDATIAGEAAIAKLYATETTQQVVDQALQIFGGLGVVKDVIVERLYRHVRPFRIFDGTSEIQKISIAKDIIRKRRLK